MDFRVVIDIQAPPERVWSVLQDVERWPEWTRSTTLVRWLDPGALSVGSLARLHQPGLLPATWRVTELEANHNFTWVTTTPGVRITAGHLIERREAGVRVTLSLTVAGLLGPMVARLTRSLIERYINMEANGLKARSEEIQRTLTPN